MNIVHASIPEGLILAPKIFRDERGFFYESYNERTFSGQTGIEPLFVQDNHSRSACNVLRGLHYQIQQVQAKLVRVVAGEIYDVVLDIRKTSPTFGTWISTALTADNRRMLWVPQGFAHGFLVTSAFAEVQYKTTDYWAPQFERCILWNDAQLNIPWPLIGTPIVSDKDQKGSHFSDAELPL